MEKIKKTLYKARYILGIVFVLSLIIVAMLHHATEVHAASWCSICQKDMNWNGTRYEVPATCTQAGYWCYRCEGCQQVGKTKHEIAALGHAWPSDFSTVDNNGVYLGERYKNCTRCGTRLDTDYYCGVYAGDGISSVSGTGWYDAGATVTINATLSEGYAWDHWEWTGGGSSTTQNYSFSIDRAYNFYAYGHATDVTITYDANGGTDAPANQIFQYGVNNYITQAKPVRVGYSFMHWTANLAADGLSDGYVLYPGDLYPAAINGGTRTLYAQWTPNDYTMTLDPNGGTCPTESVNPRYDQDWYYCMSSHTPERTGYRFLGWYDAVEGGTQVFKPDGYCTNEGTYYVDNIWKYPGDVTLYAHWEAIPRAVTYDANGGITQNREFIKYYNQEIDLSLTAEMPGYIFVGWNTVPDATTGLTSLKMQEEDITLYAIYSIEVSDVANHSYNENGNHLHGQEKDKEVFLRIWNINDEQEQTDYALEYQYDVSTMVYRYKTREPVDVTKYQNSTKAYAYAVYAYDNAGNWSVVESGVIDGGTTPPPPPPPAPEKYEQTVKHYRYDCIISEYVHFATTVEDIEENEMYKPLFITPPTGYVTERIEYPVGCTMVGADSYVVTKTETTKAYYKPKEYKITFDANGGTTSETSKAVRYGDYYGKMPTPERKGYTFTGWYTAKTGGDLVTSSDKYLLDSNSTLFAHWSINSYNVTYDYWTNGGTNVSTPQKSFNYGAPVDLSVTAVKSGAGKLNWSFVGWNTDANATTGLSSYKMTDSDVTLYAIYKKEISVTLVEQKDTGTSTKIITKTIYNNETDAEFEILNSHSWTDWTLTGWTMETGADEEPIAGNGSVCTVIDNVTLYALYTRDITLAYDTNGSSMKIDRQTKEAYHNTAGNTRYPSFVTASASELEDNSFVCWNVESGMVKDSLGNQKTTCEPGIMVTVSENTLLQAHWDAYPKLEAYNRHFTLEQARNGFITQTELLKKVKATDEEAKSEGNPEGVLRNGTDVIVLGYTSSTFTSLISDAEVFITYEATDGFGNVVTQIVTITVTDTTLQESPKKSYVRFISREFLADEDGNLLPESQGGLSETSTWRTNDSYRNLLINTLSNTKADVETWVFTREDIIEIKKKL